MHPLRRTSIAIAMSALLIQACGGGGGGGTEGPPAGALAQGVSNEADAPTANTLPSNPAAAGPGGTPVSAAVPGAVYDDTEVGRLRLATFDAINAIRVASGSGALRQNRILDAAAQGHAAYGAANPDQALSDGQTAGRPAFTGATPRDRAAGYAADPVLGHGIVDRPPAGANCADVVRALPFVSTFLWPADDLGVGVHAFDDPNGGRRVHRCILVTGTPDWSSVQLPVAGDAAVFPAPGATLSLSNPAIAPSRLVAVSTYNRAARATAAADVVVSRFELQAGAGAPVALNPSSLPVPLPPGIVVGAYSTPLTAGTTYTVRFEATVRGVPLTKTWTFSVVP